MPHLRTLVRLVLPLAAACALSATAVVPAVAAPDAATSLATTVTPPGPVIIGEELPHRLKVETDLAPGREACLPVTGVDVPDGAVGVVLNVTTVRPAGHGHVVVYPSGDVPTGSTVNFDPGRDVANAAFVALGDDGAICYRTAGARTGLIIDLTGFTLEGDGIELAGPRRLLDTRPASVVGGFDGPIHARTVFELQAAGVAGVPADAEAVILNVTVTGPSTEGNLRVYTAGANLLESSVVNFAPAGTRAAATVVMLSDEGTIAFYSDDPMPQRTGGVHVIMDVLGWTTADSPFVPWVPTRALDTRTGFGTGGAARPIAPGESFTFDATDESGVPDDAVAVVMNLAAVRPTRDGNLRVHTGGTPVPRTSTINYVPGMSVGNLTVVPVGADGRVTLTSDSAGTVHAVADVVGYLTD